MVKTIISLRTGYDSQNLRDEIHQPLCWLHGVKDDFLSITTHVGPVSRNHPGPLKEAHRVAGGARNDVPRALGYAEYARVIDTFIKN